MRIVLAYVPLAIVAALTAILVPALGRQFIPSVRFEAFLPLVVYLAAREPLWAAIPAAWVLGALGDFLCGLPAGAGVFSLQLLVIGIHYSARWVQFQSAAGFALFILPATAAHLYVQYLVLMVFGRRAILEWGLALSVAAWTAAWGVVVWHLATGAARLIARTGIVGTEKRGIDA